MRLKGNKIFYKRESSDCIPQYIYRLEIILSEMSLSTNVSEDSVVFKRPFRYSTHKRENIDEARKVLREGKITISEKDNNSVDVQYSVRLDTVVALSTIYSVISGLVIFAFVESIDTSVITAGSVLILSFFIGYYSVKNKIMTIIQNCFDS